MNNGDQETGGEPLDRIERALQFMLDDHIRFREEHKWLLSAQVQMQGGLEALRTELQALAGNVNTLTSNIEAMRAHFNARLSRLEDQ
jgi:hypothetical protein